MSENDLLASYNPYVHLDVLRDLISSSGVSNGAGLAWRSVHYELLVNISDVNKNTNSIMAYLEQYDKSYINNSIALLEMQEKIAVNDIMLVKLQFFHTTVFRNAGTKEKYDSILYNGTPISSEHVLAAFREISNNLMEERKPSPVLIGYAPSYIIDEVGESNNDQFTRVGNDYTPFPMLSSTCSADKQTSEQGNKYGVRVKPGQEVIKVDFPDGEEWPSHPVGIITRNIVNCYNCGEAGHIRRYCTKRPWYWRNEVRVPCDRCIITLSKNARYFLVACKCSKCGRPFKLHYDKHDRLEKERKGGATNRSQHKQESGNGSYLEQENIREWRARERARLQSLPKTPQRFRSPPKLSHPSPIAVRQPQPSLSPPQLADNNLNLATSSHPNTSPTQARFQPLLSALNAVPFGVPNCTKYRSVGNSFHSHGWVLEDGVWTMQPSHNKQNRNEYLQGKRPNENDSAPPEPSQEERPFKSSKLAKHVHNRPPSPPLPLPILPDLPLSPENINMYSLHTQQDVKCVLDDMTIEQMIKHEAAHRDQNQWDPHNSKTSTSGSRVEEIMSKSRKKRVTSNANASMVNEPTPSPTTNAPISSITMNNESSEYNKILTPDLFLMNTDPLPDSQILEEDNIIPPSPLSQTVPTLKKTNTDTITSLQNQQLESFDDCSVSHRSPTTESGQNKAVNFDRRIHQLQWCSSPSTTPIPSSSDRNSIAIVADERNASSLTTRASAKSKNDIFAAPISFIPMTNESSEDNKILTPGPFLMNPDPLPDSPILEEDDVIPPSPPSQTVPTLKKTNTDAIKSLHNQQLESFDYCSVSHRSPTTESGQNKAVNFDRRVHQLQRYSSPSTTPIPSSSDRNSIAIVADERNASLTTRASGKSLPQKKDIFAVKIVDNRYVFEDPPMQQTNQRQMEVEEIALSSDSDGDVNDNEKIVNEPKADHLEYDVAFRFEKNLNNLRKPESAASTVGIVEKLIRGGEFRGLIINTLQESSSAARNATPDVPPQEHAMSCLAEGSSWYTETIPKTGNGKEHNGIPTPRPLSHIEHLEPELKRLDFPTDGEIINIASDVMGAIDDEWDSAVNTDISTGKKNAIQENLEAQNKGVSQTVNITDEEIREAHVQNSPIAALNEDESIVYRSEPNSHSTLLTFERLGPDESNNDDTKEDYNQKEIVGVGSTPGEAERIVGERRINNEPNNEKDDTDTVLRSSPSPAWLKRKPGRPRIIRSGRPGRPPKPKTGKPGHTRKNLIEQPVTIHDEPNVDSEVVAAEPAQNTQANSTQHLNTTIDTATQDSAPLKDKGGRPRYEKTGKRGRPRKIRNNIGDRVTDKTACEIIDADLNTSSQTSTPRSAINVQTHQDFDADLEFHLKTEVTNSSHSSSSRQKPDQVNPHNQTIPLK